MKTKILIVLLSFFVLAANAQSAKKSIKNGKKLMEENQIEAAINEFSEAIKLEPGNTEAYLLRAGLYEKSDKVTDAVNDYIKVTQLDPKSAPTFFNVGRIYYSLKDYQNAIKYLSEATLLDAKNFQALQYKAATHIKLSQFNEALVSINAAIDINKTNLCYYTRGVAYDSLRNYPQAIQDYQQCITMSQDYEKAYVALAKCQLNAGQTEVALNTANNTISKFNNNAEAYQVRSQIFYKMKDLPSAINDLSKLETLIGNDSTVIITRAKYYFEYGQFQNAISDFATVLAQNPDNLFALYWRGRANEELMETNNAKKDYAQVLKISGLKSCPLANDARSRLFELNRENVPPTIIIDTPATINNNLAVLKDATSVSIVGKINDASPIETFTINNEPVKLLNDNQFSYQFNLNGNTALLVVATDVYKNTTKKEYGISRMEANKPVVRITTPYASDGGEIFLQANEDITVFEGLVEDESLIKDLYIDSVRATFNDTELNPRFTANIPLSGKDKIVVKAVDAFNNTLETTYTLNREGANIAASNPMGKTWVVFIENSNYQTFASLEGPTKDVSLMKGALSTYEVHNFIHKKDMTKKEMERFFSIELRDLVKKNGVNSLLVWYAGHGKFINETGYWIPVDATRDDEFTYFNINNLKASMQSYSNIITHTLVVTDACESGPSFYQAMRADNKIRSCDDVNATKFKSSQVFSSAGYELASDDSQFTKTFAKSLQFNQNTCIPIESIVNKVTEAVAQGEKQKPQFGKIAGFVDENGTFFFIKK